MRITIGSVWTCPEGYDARPKGSFRKTFNTLNDAFEYLAEEGLIVSLRDELAKP